MQSAASETIRVRDASSDPCDARARLGRCVDPQVGVRDRARVGDAEQAVESGTKIHQVAAGLRPCRQDRRLRAGERHLAQQHHVLVAFTATASQLSIVSTHRGLRPSRLRRLSPTVEVTTSIAAAVALGREGPSSRRYGGVADASGVRLRRRELGLHDPVRATADARGHLDSEPVRRLPRPDLEGRRPRCVRHDRQLAALGVAAQRLRRGAAGRDAAHQRADVDPGGMGRRPAAT